MELVAAGWCPRKWLRFDRTIRNITSSDLGMSLLVMQLGVTGLDTNTRTYNSLTCLRG